MKTFIGAALLLLIPAMTTPAAAEEKFDAAARAKTIAPLVDTQTFAIVHVDVTRLAGSALFDRLVEWFPDVPRDLRPRAAMHETTDKLARAGVKDVYCVFTVAISPVDGFTFAAIPLGPAADEKAILASLSGQLSHVRVGDMLVLHPRQKTLQRIGELRAEPLPELSAAMETAGDTAIQVVFLPSSDIRRVIEELMPELPKEIGGGPSTVFTHGISWAAVGFDLPPKISPRLVVQSRDTQAALALKAKCSELLEIAGRQTELRRVLKDFDQVAALVSPKVAGDRLLLTISDQDGSIQVLGAAWRSVADLVMEPVRRLGSTNNLRQLGLAMHNHHDVFKCFPPPAIYSPDGKPLLSWRVMLLPFLDQTPLYKQFHLNEPWDSPHNRALVAKMPGGVSLSRLEGRRREPDELRRADRPGGPSFMAAKERR